ncbi:MULTISPECIES: alpha-glucosidase [Enterococcus]|uniref:Glycosyl hydrolase family 13 catalytic domain-containing protein n=1 Tax=Enterococcus sulfureus ATCC 49903 TaxID=1140003 RepID=S0KXX3_9ENTE|nr:alpha-glucosidase [Enterococcus sulfureus]EOT45890.1 hypothetical protein OMY_01911 [Enterococcus sulfureus ATCC 49903]EOT83059.1 hypothetical protein I573_02172 [Enterococcus sulfureus ATCC 49903]
MKTNKQQAWWKEEVVYQIYPKSFYDTNEDGIGDINGIIEKLPYLADLGITTIWICPIFTSPMVDNGYDISDFQNIQPEFGTMEDFDRLLHQAKQNQIKIILDLVVNHTSDEHEWFQKALTDQESPYRDYYIFKEGSNNTPPNNWRSIFGGSVWEAVPNEKNMYYFHTFDKRQPDLNWENPRLREEIYAMINWWLEKGISGFRIDSITFIKKDQDYQSVPADGADGLANVKHKGRNRPGIELFLKELNDETFKKFDCVTVGEAPGVMYEEYDQFIGKDGYFNMIFDFHYADIDVENGSEWFRQHHWDVPELNGLIEKSQMELQRHGWGANFLENHDQPRSLSKYIRDEDYQNEIGAKALATLFFLLRGTPFIYQGQEIGMRNAVRQSLEEFDDVSSIDNYHRALLEGYSKEEAMHFVNSRSRDNSRTPFQWDATQYAGFSKHRPWLDLAQTPPQINLEKEYQNQHSVYHYYKKLIQLRNHSAYSQTLIYGEIEFKDVADDVICYQRKGEKTVTIYINLSKKTAELDLTGKMILSNYPLIETKTSLAPYQALVLEEV